MSSTQELLRRIQDQISVEQRRINALEVKKASARYFKPPTDKPLSARASRRVRRKFQHAANLEPIDWLELFLAAAAIILFSAFYLVIR